MEILNELFDVRNEVLTEDVGDGKKRKRYIVEGICIQSEVKNRNGRIYPKRLIKPEIDQYIREQVETNRAVGELNHPETDPSINYERVSHKFESLVESGNDWIGRAVITRGTPMGSIVAGLMDEGVQMGISSRATGSTAMSGGAKVVQSFRLRTAGDIVSDPSAPDAFLTNLMEGKEWVWENGILQEREKAIITEVNTMARRKQLNEAGTRLLFQRLIKSATGA